MNTLAPSGLDSYAIRGASEGTTFFMPPHLMVLYMDYCSLSKTIPAEADSSASSESIQSVDFVRAIYQRLS